MQFRLLGLLEVEEEHGPVRIVPGRESALVALLLLHAPEALSTDRIVEEIWGEDAPPTARKSVQVHVSRLRKALGAERLETTPAGYRLRVAPDELDVRRFEALVRAGRNREALELWRGEPLADFRYLAFAQGEARRLGELHDEAVTGVLEERLVRGEAPVAELEALVAGSPLWERPRGQLMRALYLAGRQADALELYRRTRALLHDELGVEPGPELQRLERAILNQDPELGTPAPPRPDRARRRAPVLLAAGGVLVAAAALGVALALTHGGSARLASVQGNAVVGIDLRTNRIVEQVAVGSRPARLAVDGGSVAVVNAGDATITRFDERDPGDAATFGTGSIPSDLVASRGALWVANADGDLGVSAPRSVSRYPAGRHAPDETVTLPAARPGQSGAAVPERRLLAAGGGSLWAVGADGLLVRLDPARGTVVQTTSVHAAAIAFGDGRLWALDADRNAVDRVDPKTGSADVTIAIPTPLTLGGIAVGGGAVWVTSPFQGVVWRIVPGPPVNELPISLRFGAATIAYGDGAAWVGNNFDDSVVRIDARTDRPRVVASVPAPQDIAVGRDRVWVAAGSVSGRSGALASGACGSVVYGGPGRPDVLIASDFDLEGQSADITRPMARTVEAVLRAARFRAGRFRVGLQSCDDASRAAGGLDTGQCIANARAYDLDRTVVGVVGGQSPCVSAQVPILDRAPGGPIAVVSPTSVTSFLTHAPRQDPNHLADVYGSGVRDFARTIAPDHVETAADAVLARRLGMRRVAVVFDAGGFISGAERDWFAYAAAREPGLRALAVPAQGSLTAAVRRLRADGAFLTAGAFADPAAAATAIAALRGALPASRIIVSSGYTPFSSLAGGGGVNGTLSGPTRARDLSPFERRLLASLPAADRVPFAVGPTIEATRALLVAIARSDGTRRSITRALLAEPRFDRGGDPVGAPVTVFRLDPSATSRIEELRGGVVETVIRPPRRLVVPPQPVGR
jgi:DNA-binding SARP family transcriptional activator